MAIALRLAALIGFIVLLRTAVAVIYLPFHLSLNRRNWPIEAREEWMSWVVPVVRILLIIVIALNGFALFDE